MVRFPFIVARRVPELSAAGRAWVRVFSRVRRRKLEKGQREKPRIRNKRSSPFVRSWKEVQGFLQSEAMSQKARGSGSDLKSRDGQRVMN